MISKVSTMHYAKMETACRKMAESYVDYEMTGRNLGMCEHLDKEHFYRLTRGYLEAAVRNGSLYSAGDKQEGYFIFETPETKRSLSGSLLQATWSLRAFGLKKGIRYVKEILDSGTYLASEFGRQKKPFTKIEFIAVAKEHQGHGYMRQMMVEMTEKIKPEQRFTMERDSFFGEYYRAKVGNSEKKTAGRSY